MDRELKPTMLIATTNDQWQDQRMQRWCQTLVRCGWKVHWIGVCRRRLVPLQSTESICYERIQVTPSRGFLFYAFFNLQLLRKAITLPVHAYLSVDADTLPALRIASWIRKKQLWFDAHEWFTEVPELRNRPLTRACWLAIIRIFLRGHIRCYTVGHEIAIRLERHWLRPFGVLRNMPSTKDQRLDILGSRSNQSSPSLHTIIPGLKEPYLLYQGALNIGRGLKELIQAAALGLPYPLVIAGSGDMDNELAELVQRENLEHKVLLIGPQDPNTLEIITRHAFLGFNLLETTSLSYYFSLANKFFDYVHAGLPQVCIDFPEYRHHMALHRVGWLIENTEPAQIAKLCHAIALDSVTYQNIQDNCRKAAEQWTWEQESSDLQIELRNLRGSLTRRS